MQDTRSTQFWFVNVNIIDSSIVNNVAFNSCNSLLIKKCFFGLLCNCTCTRYKIKSQNYPSYQLLLFTMFTILLLILKVQVLLTFAIEIGRCPVCLCLLILLVCPYLDLSFRSLQITVTVTIIDDYNWVYNVKYQDMVIIWNSEKIYLHKQINNINIYHHLSIF